MPGFPHNYLLRHSLILSAVLLAYLVSVFPAGAGEPDAQPTTNLITPPQNQSQTQPAQNGTKAKLQPADLLPSLLSPRKGTGSVDNSGAVMSRDIERLRRSGRLNNRINQDMRRLNNSIRDMRKNINHTLKVRRQRF